MYIFLEPVLITTNILTMYLKFILFVTMAIQISSATSPPLFRPYPITDERCPPGKYVSFDDDTQICKDYKLLGENCTNSGDYCSPILFCHYDTNTCVYSWDYNRISTCNSQEKCAKYQSCPSDTILVEADGDKICCDSCSSKSKLGDYCDSKQLCLPGLRCEDKICLPSEKCGSTQCEEITSKDCGPDEYFVPKDGIKNCCDHCQKYFGLGDECDDSRNKFCNAPLMCQVHRSKPNVCVHRWDYTYVENCKNAFCPTIKSCPDDSILRRSDGNTICCDSCDQKSSLGNYCDDEIPCQGALQCTNNRCSPSEKCSNTECPSEVSDCPLSQYLVHKNGDDICCNTCKYYGQLYDPCNLNTYCAPQLYCNYENSTCISLTVPFTIPIF